MKCSVVGCGKEGEYPSTVDGHCGDINTYEIMLCREHYNYLHGIDDEEEKDGHDA